MDKRKQLGQQGEDLVAQKLQQDGFTILERNYRKQYGEIDLIACKDDVLAFVEVKMRTRCYFDLSEVITRSKQRKIAMVAQYYAVHNNYDDKVWRFDVALVEQGKTSPTITYLPNAFTADDNYV